MEVDPYTPGLQILQWPYPFTGIPMKAERRHDLQNNELAERLAVLINKAGPQKNLIGGIVILAIVAIAAGSYLAGKGARDKAMGWADYFSMVDSTNSDGLKNVAAAYAGTPAGEWAENAVAFKHLGEAAQQAFTNRDESRDSYEQAKAAFQDLIAKASNDHLKSRAMIGLAQAHEGLGEIDEAIAGYKAVVESFPDSVLANSAAASQAALEKPSQRDWYTWFASQEPKTSPLADPTLFNNMNNLPSDPNITIPEAGSLIQPDGASTSSPIKLDGPSNAPESEEATTDSLDFSDSTEAEPGNTDSTATEDGEVELTSEDETSPEVELTESDEATADSTDETDE